jgi:hypothetical protein
VAGWAPGDIASNGIEIMAETGSISALKLEFVAAGSTTGVKIEVAGIDSPDTVATTFDITPSHPLVSLVTMIAPSPDWFIGVSDLELYDGAAWVPQVTIDLLAYDAGTDSGVDFTSPDADVTPHEPIALLGAPFTGTPALGTFTFTLVGDGNLDGVVNGLDYLIWADAYGDNPAADPPGSPENGDYDDNGRVDGNDYLAWAGNYGAGIATTVPEPGALALLLVGMLASGLVRRRRL